MSYEQALEAAGAEVLAFKEFGSYQGEWWAKVRYQGETGWVSGSYGSCSGCDAFDAEFGYNDHDKCKKHQYVSVDFTCPDCAEAKQKYENRLADFGRTYLDGLLTQEEAEKSAGLYIEWDAEAAEMLSFVVDNKL